MENDMSDDYQELQEVLEKTIPLIQAAVEIGTLIHEDRTEEDAFAIASLICAAYVENYGKRFLDATKAAADMMNLITARSHSASRRHSAGDA
jgi:hypothetical protein